MFLLLYLGTGYSAYLVHAASEFPVAGASASQQSASALLARRLTDLSVEFGTTLETKVNEVRRVWSLLPQSPSREEAQNTLVKIHDIVHTLAGFGKSFGYPEVSKAAAPLDGLFRLITEQNQGLTKEERDQIGLLITDLERATQAPRQEIRPEELLGEVEAANPRAELPQILILGASASEAGELTEAISAFGYQAQTISETEDISNISEPNQDCIIYADISKGDEHLKQLRKRLDLSRFPLILSSSQSAFGDRLKAVRTGAAVFLAKPFSPEDFLERVNAITEAKSERPFRVVIAEDDGPLATFYQTTLEHAGMETRVIRRPSQLLDTLSGFDPDLIVMDMYMPECTGLELAQIVRQFPGYTTAPILFLSTESRLDLQLKARHLGADDFLAKPLQPGQLISAVTSRAKRYRDLKKLTDRDSLTGLLNHSNILRNLEREMNLATRTGHHVSFAMVDIDHFKSVNDTYGHVTGDQVIVRITHLIRNRLRRVDYVGRYSGEEFAIVMPNTDVTKAKEVVDALREAARELVFETENGSFNVTFSSGIAAYPTYSSVLELTQAADEALYKAKRGGRNQVVIAE